MDTFILANIKKHTQQEPGSGLGLLKGSGLEAIHSLESNLARGFKKTRLHWKSPH